MVTLEQFLNKEIEPLPQKVDKNHTQELIEQYKEIILTNIIQQFALGPIFDIYKRGGNVTT